MFEQAFKNIDDVLRNEAGCTTELDYTEQTSWLLFLKYLDALVGAGKLRAGCGPKKSSHLYLIPTPEVEKCALCLADRQRSPLA